MSHNIAALLFPVSLSSLWPSLQVISSSTQGLALTRPGIHGILASIFSFDETLFPKSKTGHPYHSFSLLPASSFIVLVIISSYLHCFRYFFFPSRFVTSLSLSLVVFNVLTFFHVLSFLQFFICQSFLFYHLSFLSPLPFSFIYSSLSLHSFRLSVFQ